MVLAVTFEESIRNRYKNEHPDRGGGVAITPLLGSRKSPDLPMATLNEVDAGHFNTPHFHVVDQFQIIVEGKCKLARHQLAPYSVHFSRAYTPYGPIVSDDATGVKMFILRAHPDTGSLRVPQSLDQLRQVPNRQPWQTTRQVTFPVSNLPPAGADVNLESIPGINDERGLAAHTLVMQPNTITTAPHPSSGEGQYLLILDGSFLHEQKELKAWALVFVYPTDSALRISAGPQGLKALILNFPKRAPFSTSANAIAHPGVKKWQCTLCAFSYDEALGMPDDGIPPGTRWQDVPDTWICPDCSASKADFQMVEL